MICLNDRKNRVVCGIGVNCHLGNWTMYKQRAKDKGNGHPRGNRESC